MGPSGVLGLWRSRKTCKFKEMSLGIEETEEGVGDRRFTSQVLELELRPLHEHRVETWLDSIVEEFQAGKIFHSGQYFCNVKFLVRTESIEDKRQRGDEANIMD